jgi:hypothetical protein
VYAQVRLVEQRFAQDALSKKLRAEIDELASGCSADGTKARSWSRKVKSLQLQLQAANKSNDIQTRLLTAATRNVDLLKLQLSAASAEHDVERAAGPAGAVGSDRAGASARGSGGDGSAKWKDECKHWQNVAIAAQRDLMHAKERSPACHICTATRLIPLSHLHQDWAHPRRICTGAAAYRTERPFLSGRTRLPRRTARSAASSAISEASWRPSTSSRRASRCRTSTSRSKMPH